MNNGKIKYLILIFSALVIFFSNCRNHATQFSADRDKFIADSGEARFRYSYRAIIRGDTLKRVLSLIFTGDEFGDGGEFIAKCLMDNQIKASFFLTGNFYRNPKFEHLVRQLKRDGNYLGSHSDKHLLYCDWTKRDSLLITKSEFIKDLNNSYRELGRFGIGRTDAHYFVPPYEWYNDSISMWSEQEGLQIVNFTPGTLSNADYTFPEMGKSYADSKSIYSSIVKFENGSISGLNGFILLVHIGTDPRRTDKFYLYLSDLITEMKKKGYRFVRIDELLSGF